MKTQWTHAGFGGRTRKASLPALAVACTLLAGALTVPDALATSASGVVGEPIATGILPEAIRAKMKDEGGFGSGALVSDVAVVRFTIAPGGYFGWHRHGGPVWVVVEQGTLTLYDPDVAGCAQTYGPGSAFLDSGDHVHNARNESATDVVVYGTFLLPQGGALRVDAADPGTCLLPPL